jgi:thiol-disulfide isomerase/thioredoxin
VSHSDSKWRMIAKDAAWVLAFFLLAAVAFNIYKTWHIDFGNARQLKAELLTGEQFDLETTGKPVLLQFWASWCPICSMEFDPLQSLSEDYQVITVAMNSGHREEVSRFMAEKQLGFPVIVDTDAELARSWQVSGVPASFIIGKDNTIRFAEIGYTTELGLRFRLWLAGL